LSLEKIQNQENKVYPNFPQFENENEKYNQIGQDLDERSEDVEVLDGGSSNRSHELSGQFSQQSAQQSVPVSTATHNTKNDVFSSDARIDLNEKESQKFSMFNVSNITPEKKSEMHSSYKIKTPTVEEPDKVTEDEFNFFDNLGKKSEDQSPNININIDQNK